MTLKSLFASTAFVLTLAGAAHADDTRFYGQLNVGIDMQEDEEIRGANASGAARNIDLELDNGDYFGAALGMVATQGDWGRSRVEIEVSHRKSELGALFLNDVERAVKPGSDVSSAEVTVTAYYDTPIYFDRVRGFAGLGMGVAMLDHDIGYRIDRGELDAIAIRIPSSESTYLVKAAIGAEVMLSPNWSLVGDVRYTEYGDTQVERFNFSAGSLDSVLDVSKSGMTLTSGIRYSF